MVNLADRIECGRLNPVFVRDADKTSQVEGIRGGTVAMSGEARKAPGGISEPPGAGS